MWRGVTGFDVGRLLGLVKESEVEVPQDMTVSGEEWSKMEGRGRQFL